MSKHTVLTFLAIQQLYLSPAGGSASPGLIFVLQVLLYDFFIMFLCGMKAYCIPSATFVLCRTPETFSESLNYWLYRCHLGFFFPDHSGLTPLLILRSHPSFLFHILFSLLTTSFYCSSTTSPCTLILKHF